MPVSRCMVFINVSSEPLLGKKMFVLSVNKWRGPVAVVKAACLENRTSLVRASLWQNVSSLLTCKDSILWEASVIER